MFTRFSSAVVICAVISPCWEAVTLADEVVVAAKTAPFTILKDGTVHEAFATPDCYYTDTPAPAPKVPPAELIEAKPAIAAQLEKRAVWIPGYWDWNPATESFVWTTGVWRFPPPKHKWIPGQWSNTKEGFVRSRGRWVGGDIQTVTYVNQPPKYKGAFILDSSLAKDQFWVPGCWTPAAENQFAWREGYVSKRVQNWVWVPAQYSWTPKGWIFTDGYWDYPVAARGQVFASLKLEDGTYSAEQLRVESFAAIPAEAIREANSGEFVYSIKELDKSYEFVSVDDSGSEVPEAPVVMTRVLPERPMAAIRGVVHRGALTPANIDVELIGHEAQITTTDENGQFVFPAVPYGVYYVRAHGPVQNHIKRAYGKLVVGEPAIDAHLELQ